MPPAQYSLTEVTVNIQDLTRHSFSLRVTWLLTKLDFRLAYSISFINYETGNRRILHARYGKRYSMASSYKFKHQSNLVHNTKTEFELRAFSPLNKWCQTWMNLLNWVSLLILWFLSTQRISWKLLREKCTWFKSTLQNLSFLK